MYDSSNWYNLPDLLPLEPPENIGRLTPEIDPDEWYEDYRDGDLI